MQGSDVAMIVLPRLAAIHSRYRARAPRGLVQLMGNPTTFCISRN
jgi:hypothetical protein